MTCTCQSPTVLWSPSAVAPFKDTPWYMFNDPVMGEQNNCALIASLSSVAWVMESLRLSCTYLNTNGNGSRNYRVSFWPGPLNVTVSDVFPIDTSRDQPYCNAHARDKLEIWPALYEKAYAVQFHGAGEDPCPLPVFLNDSTSPNRWNSNPLKPLWNLTGCGDRGTQQARSISDSGLYDFFQEIKNRCTSGKTSYPMAIWTYPQNKLPQNVDGVIKSDHVYTVLGHKYVNNIEYLILRDPRGVTVTNPASPNCILSGNVTFNNNFRQNCATQLRNYYNSNIIVTLGSGIFGIAGTKIEDYFEGFAWAGP